MPKLRPETAKLRAVKLVKSLAKHGGNQSKVAKELGITPQSISDRLKQPVVKETIQDTVNKCLKKAGITTDKVYSQLDRQLKAKRKFVIGGNTDNPVELEEDDWNAQDKARKDALTLMGHLKPPAEANKPTEIIIQYGYRETSPVRDEDGRDSKPT